VFFGIAGLLLFVIGFPISLLFVIWRGRQVGTFGDVTFTHRFVFLYVRFDEEYWYWEFVLMLHAGHRVRSHVPQRVSAVGQWDRGALC
jgi:hypothetical protein